MKYVSKYLSIMLVLSTFSLSSCSRGDEGVENNSSAIDSGETRQITFDATTLSPADGNAVTKANDGFTTGAQVLYYVVKEDGKTVYAQQVISVSRGSQITVKVPTSFKTRVEFFSFNDKSSCPVINLEKKGDFSAGWYWPNANVGIKDLLYCGTDIDFTTTPDPELSLHFKHTFASTITVKLHVGTGFPSGTTVTAMTVQSIEGIADDYAYYTAAKGVVNTYDEDSEAVVTFPSTSTTGGEIESDLFLPDLEADKLTINFASISLSNGDTKKPKPYPMDLKDKDGTPIKMIPGHHYIVDITITKSGGNISIITGNVSDTGLVSDTNNGADIPVQ
ncbi:MAG: hypothetical protein LBN24_00675 [Mediterranea sp.]|jgi:hypothetical protein|nr:hypothetical protein [Mediterranea sp.]